MNVRGWLVRLYPRQWRERYADEFEMLLEECLRSPLDVLDILLGALDAHLEFPYEMNWRLMNMVNKLRTSILIVFAAYIGFVVGGMSLYGLADDSPMAALMNTGANLPLQAAWLTVEAGAVLALAAVVIGGGPIAWTVIRRALRSKGGDLRLLLVPPASFLALVLYAAFILLVGFGRVGILGVLPSVSPEDFPLENRLLIGGFMLVFVLGAIASTAAVWRLISRSGAEEGTLQLPGSAKRLKIYEYAFRFAVVTALAMLVMLIATVAWGWLSYAALPAVFAQNWGLLLTNTTASLGVTILVMVLSTAAAFFGIARGLSSRRASV